MRPLLLPQDVANAEFLRWLESRTERNRPLSVTSFATLWNDYLRWCGLRSLPSSCILTRTAFGRSLRQAGCHRSKDGRGCSQWRGIALKQGPCPDGELHGQYTDSCPVCGAVFVGGTAIDELSNAVERRDAE